MWFACCVVLLFGLASAQKPNWDFNSQGQDILQVGNKIPDECAWRRSVNGPAPCNRADSAVTVYLPALSKGAGLPDAPKRAAALAAFNAAVVSINIKCRFSTSNYCEKYLFALSSGPDNCNTIDAGSSVPVKAVVGSAAIIQIDTPAALTAWTSVLLELEDTPRLLCVRRAAGQPYDYAGIKISVGFNCDNTDNKCSNNMLAHITDSGNLDLTNVVVDPITKAAFSSATKCCISAAKDSMVTLGGAPIGRCINPAVHDCCGGSPFLLNAERKCVCDEGKVEIVAKLAGPSTDVTDSANTGFQCPCVGASKERLSVGCPAAETCCLQSKFDSLKTATDLGSCYNPLSHGCCDVGQIYDPGTFQCCRIEGVLKVSDSCGCASDSDCQGGQNTPFSNLKCCIQTSPAVKAGNCDRFANFPADVPLAFGPLSAGPANPPPSVAKCLGKCIDPRFQICCNGQQCRKQFERCCNATCCNTFTQSCNEAFLKAEGALKIGDPLQPLAALNYGVRYMYCTTDENLNPLRAFWVFILPTVLLTATLVVSALALVFANKASSRDYSGIEIALLIVATGSIIFALPTYFSPLYKYGIVVVLVAVVTILSAATRVKALNVIALIANVVLVVYLLDPFHGNYYLTLSTHRQPANSPTSLGQYVPDVQASGILHHIQKMWKGGHINPGPTAVSAVNYCSRFYDGYFTISRGRDTLRLENPQVEFFGYCSREWVVSLLIFEGIVIVATLLQVVLVLIALLLRFSEGTYRNQKVKVATETIAPVASYYVQ